MIRKYISINDTWHFLNYSASNPPLLSGCKGPNRVSQSGRQSPTSHRGGWIEISPHSLPRSWDLRQKTGHQMPPPSIRNRGLVVQSWWAVTCSPRRRWSSSSGPLGQVERGRDTGAWREQTCAQLAVTEGSLHFPSHTGTHTRIPHRNDH